ncbi:MAG: aromatic ring-opening dioxygenase subunit LigA [Candidatus Rariloculaceae bacterium]
MSLYAVQKLVQNVNRNLESRQRFLDDRASLAADYNLTAEERTAVVEFNIHDLYALGVHPLLLRPFTIIHGVSERDYLGTIRGDD